MSAALGADLAAWPGFEIDMHAWMALCVAGFVAAVMQSPITAASSVAKTVSAQFGPELSQSLAWEMTGEAPGGRT